MQFLILLFLCFHAQAQFSSSTTSKVDVIRNNATANVTLSPSGDVVLTPATVDTLIYADADKKLKSTTYSPNDVVTKDPITNEVLINGYLNLVSTTQGSVSCPVMTEAQRDLIATPATGECVFNSNSQSLNVYDGSTWKSAGGGISQWVTAFNYSINDIVVYVGEIYQALTAHTSGTFTTDLANGEWVKIADTIQSQGLKDLSSATYKNVAVPNKQATAIGSNTVLLENGNQNLLSNPSFEHATYDTGWTCTGDSVESKETTIIIDGNASLETDATADTFECYQDTTLYQAQLSGVQGQASVWIKTNDVTVQICARQAGTTLTGANCVTVNANNEWREYIIPFVMGTTSNGISIAGTLGTGTTYIDNAYVGIMPANRTPEISQAQIAVEAYIASATNCQWSRTSTTVGAFGTDADCPGPTIVRQNVGTWSTTDTDLPRFTGSNLPAGQYKATMIFPNFMSASAVAAAAINDGTATCNPISITSDPGNSSSNSVSCTFSYDSVSTSRTYELYVGSASSTVNLPNSVTTPGFGVKFILEYYPPKSKIYSQQCTSDLDCENVFSAKVSSAGVVSGENLDWINGNAVVTSTSNYAITFNSNIFTVAPNCTTAIDTNAGNSAVAQTYSVTSSGLSVVTVNVSDSLVAKPFNIICQKQGADFKQKNVITGTFANVVTAPNIAKPKTCYYAFGGASATLASPTECTTGTCQEVYDSCSAGTPPAYASGGTYTDLTFANGTFKPNTFIDCKCTPHDVISGSYRSCSLSWFTGDTSWMTNANGGAVLNMVIVNSAGAVENAHVSISCTADAP